MLSEQQVAASDARHIQATFPCLPCHMQMSPDQMQRQRLVAIWPNGNKSHGGSHSQAQAAMPESA